LIAWGAGINKPQFENSVHGSGISPPSWRLSHLKRFDVEQADIATLMVSVKIYVLNFIILVTHVTQQLQPI